MDYKTDAAERLRVFMDQGQQEFNPWDFFDAVYGTYDSDFDDMAIGVLKDLMHRTNYRFDLASDMFREMLCKSGLCEYGSGPCACFPTQYFDDKLPKLIEMWEEYRSIAWGDD